MEILIILIIISVGIATGFLVAFMVSVKNKQFDDLYSPSLRILFEKSNKNNKSNLTNSYYNEMNNILELESEK